MATALATAFAIPAGPAAAAPGREPAALPDAPVSTFFGTAAIEEAESVGTDSDGDLWPSCWAGNGNLYTTNGDGKGFSLDGPFADIAVNEDRGRRAEPDRRDGGPRRRGRARSGAAPGTTGSRPGWSASTTRMYLAVQDLALDFNDVPAATIAKSTDHGRTWTWDQRKPMFDDHVFTTIWFADFGQGGAAAPDGYVYAYGLDGNWRDSFDDTVADPQDVYLARVPKAKVQDRVAWEFYAGLDEQRRSRSGRRSIAERKPVLTDERRLYGQTYGTTRQQPERDQPGRRHLPAAQKRYVYTSWTEYTFEFYESPTPWGPWKHFLSKDFGGYPWSTSKYGGYAATHPVQVPPARTARPCTCRRTSAPVVAAVSVARSTTSTCASCVLTPPTRRAGEQPAGAGANLAAPGTDAVAISKSSQFGQPRSLNDGSALATRTTSTTR